MNELPLAIVKTIFLLEIGDEGILRLIRSQGFGCGLNERLQYGRPVCFQGIEGVDEGIVGRDKRGKLSLV